LIISAVKEDDIVTHYVGTYTDISERKQMEEQVRQLAFYDTLTNLPNRRLINDRLSQIMATSKRTGCHGAVLFLDLDNFKPLNDAHGHEVGDLLLIEAANRLRNCVREMDTVGRFGGDEFVVILAELNASRDASTTQARIVADKICASLSAPYQLSLREAGKADSIEHRCTASIGVALFIDHQASQDDILRWADAAMYRAKEAGRNLIRFHDST
jgi:diguanylate cyclase (GGDEF)-like protein